MTTASRGQGVKVVQARYVATTDAVLRASANPNSNGTKLLLGVRLNVDDLPDAAGFRRATATSGATGFVHDSELSVEQQLKIFYIDVGQGDAALLEADGLVMVIDGGPDTSLVKFLRKRRTAVRAANEQAGIPNEPRLHIDYMVLTHPDLDHYQGLTHVLNDDDFSVGTLLHNGLVRYGEPAGMDLDLGTRAPGPNGEPGISADLSDVASTQALIDSGDVLTANGGLNKFGRFLFAAVGAHTAGRLGEMRTLSRHDPTGPTPTLDTGASPVAVEVLGPVPLTAPGANPVLLPAFPDPHDVTPQNPQPAPSDSHTINGNSIVLRVRFGTKKFLFGGDLNQPSQLYLSGRYPRPEGGVSLRRQQGVPPRLIGLRHRVPQGRESQGHGVLVGRQRQPRPPAARCPRCCRRHRVRSVPADLLHRARPRTR